MGRIGSTGSSSGATWSVSKDDGWSKRGPTATRRVVRRRASCAQRDGRSTRRRRCRAGRRSPARPRRPRASGHGGRVARWGCRRGWRSGTVVDHAQDERHARGVGGARRWRVEAHGLADVPLIDEHLRGAHHTPADDLQRTAGIPRAPRCRSMRSARWAGVASAPASSTRSGQPRGRHRVDRAGRAASPRPRATLAPPNRSG